jgi:hypothetical protein
MCHIIMAAAVAHHRGVRNEDDICILSLSPSLSLGPHALPTGARHARVSKTQSGDGGAHCHYWRIRAALLPAANDAAAVGSPSLARTSHWSALPACVLSADGNDWWFYYLS